MLLAFPEIDTEIFYKLFLTFARLAKMGCTQSQSQLLKDKGGQPSQVGVTATLQCKEGAFGETRKEFRASIRNIFIV